MAQMVLQTDISASRTTAMAIGTGTTLREKSGRILFRRDLTVQDMCMQGFRSNSMRRYSCTFRQGMGSLTMKSMNWQDRFPVIHKIARKVKSVTWLGQFHKGYRFNGNFNRGADVCWWFVKRGASFFEWSRVEMLLRL